MWQTKVKHQYASVQFRFCQKGWIIVYVVGNLSYSWFEHQDDNNYHHGSLFHVNVICGRVVGKSLWFIAINIRFRSKGVELVCAYVYVGKRSSCQGFDYSWNANIRSCLPLTKTLVGVNLVSIKIPELGIYTKTAVCMTSMYANRISNQNISMRMLKLYFDWSHTVWNTIYIILNT